MKKIILAFVLSMIYILPVFSFSDESRADLRRAADWWEAREDKLNVRLGELERKNPDPSDPNDKTWQEYLKVLDEIKTAEAKQKLYRETARFDYTRSIIKDTVKVYRPAADFMEFTVGRGVELVKALISQSWQDLVKLSVDSVLRTRIRMKIRSILGCDKNVPELENWLVVMGFGEDPWDTTVDQAVLSWARGEAEGKAMLLSLQLEKGRQIYKDFLKKPNLSTQWEAIGKTPAQWLESQTVKPASQVMDVLGLGSFISDLGGRLWISMEMNDSIDDTLENLKALRKKYKEKDVDLNCEDLFLVWSKQKTINIEDPEEKARLEKLKTGLEFFKKKIPGWYQNNTVPDHFEEIVRMIPVAEELGEFDTAENLRDILIEFEYKKMTPEEIAASEKQSLIEESRGYLISNLKVLRNFLTHKNYEDADSQWDITKSRWEDLINLGYNTDTDAEIQGLWKEIEPMLKNMNGTVSGSEENGGASSGSLGLPVLNEVNYKDKFLAIAQKYYDAANSKNYKLAKMYCTVFHSYGRYLYEEKNIAIRSDEKWIKDIQSRYFNFMYEITSRIDDANSYSGNPNYSKFKEEFLNYLTSYENRLRSFGEDAIDEDHRELDKLSIRWGMMGIDAMEDLYKNPELNARFEKIYDLEEEIRRGDIPLNGNSSTINNFGPVTNNSSF